MENHFHRRTPSYQASRQDSITMLEPHIERLLRAFDSCLSDRSMGESRRNAALLRTYLELIAAIERESKQPWTRRKN